MKAFSWSFGDIEKVIRQIKEIEEPDELRRIANVTAKQLQAVGVNVRFRSSHEGVQVAQMSNSELLQLIEKAAAELRSRQPK